MSTDRKEVIRKYVVVGGRVQGVGFRFFCQYQATEYNLTGWVHNMDNGDVDLEIQGTRENIDRFLDKLLQGDQYIKIWEYREESRPLKADKSFRILV